MAHGVWIEVKPSAPTPTEKRLAEKLAKESYQNVWLVYSKYPDSCPASLYYRGRGNPSSDICLFYNSDHPHHPFYLMRDFADVPGFSKESKALQDAIFLAKNMRFDSGYRQ